MFDPARVGEVLCKFLIRLTYNFSAFIECDGTVSCCAKVK